MNENPPTLNDLGDANPVPEPGQPSESGSEDGPKAPPAVAPITPTVGRVVWFYPNRGLSRGGLPMGSENGPWKADIVWVHGMNLVNLLVVDPIGRQICKELVHFVQPVEDRPPSGTPYATWMPYQVKKPFGSESGEKGAGTQSI